jgi:hypothetical protein
MKTRKINESTKNHTINNNERRKTMKKSLIMLTMVVTLAGIALTCIPDSASAGKWGWFQYNHYFADYQGETFGIGSAKPPIPRVFWMCQSNPYLWVDIDHTFYPKIYQSKKAIGMKGRYFFPLVQNSNGEYHGCKHYPDSDGVPWKLQVNIIRLPWHTTPFDPTDYALVTLRVLAKGPGEHYYLPIDKVSAFLKLLWLG